MLKFMINPCLSSRCTIGRNLSGKTIIILLFIITFCCSYLSATIINIPADQPTIQEGINIAVDTDTVLVQPGTYVEYINYNGKLITLASLFLTTQDTSYISQTIIDGDQNSRVVKFGNGEDSTAVLNGFTITNGSASSGGGIFCSNYCSPSLKNVTIIGNTADVRGGGIYCDNNSSPSLVNVTIIGNSAVGDYSSGGGIYCNWDSSPSLVNVTISGNSAVGDYSDGGGIYCWVSSPSLENVTIIENSASFGGGIYCYESSPSLLNVTIIENSAEVFGGGIYCYNYSGPSMENVTITKNSAIYYGGGICCDWYSSPSLENVTIIENSAEVYGGGGIFCFQNCSPSLKNVTIIENSASFGGGIYCQDNSYLSLVNCILWNDYPQEIYLSEYSDPNTITISYSDVNGGESGIITNNNGTVNWLEGNIDADPLFLDPTNGDYHLTENSPCIDAGDPDSPLDPDGTRADIGAYYYDQSPAPLCAAFYADKTVDIIPAIISFFDQSSPIGTINSWLWDFGDETNETIQNPVHTYNEAGFYTVSLIVSNLVCSDTLTYDNYITVYPNTSLIWPGDTDYSGSVDETDIDAIAIYFREQGTPRDIVSFEWIGNNYPTGWEEPFASLADCNGDGEVNITDVLAICLNWNKTHSTVLESPLIPKNLEQYRDNFVEIYNSLGNSEIEIKIRNHIAEKFDLPIIEIMKINKLYQNYPNPFNPDNPRFNRGGTIISFSLTTANAENAKIEIYNVKGQKVRNLECDESLVTKAPMYRGYSITWDGRDENNKPVSSGIYFYKLHNNNKVIDCKKMLIIK